MKPLLEKLKHLPFTLQILVAASLLVISVVLVGGEKAKQYERDYLTEETRIQTERMFEVFVASNIDPIIAEDSPLLESAVEYVIELNPEILLIEIQNEEGKSLVKWSKDKTVSSDEIIEFKKRVIYEGELFGYVYITRSIEDSILAIESHIRYVYLIMLLLLAVLLILLAIIAYVMITRPMHRINSRIWAYLEGKEDPEKYQFYSREFNLLNASVDKLREITSGRDLLQDEMEVRIQIQFELEKARRAAEQANSAKTDFLSFMTHEIRTPLTAIIGFSENLLDYNQSMEDRLDAIHTVINSSNHLLQLINDVLDIAKIEAGHLETESIEIDLLGLLKEVTSIVRALIKNQDIEFIVEAQHRLPVSITTDPLRLKQILINVISNAIKFTHKGRITLSLDYDAMANEMLFRVIDTGIGMTKEQKERLFKAYDQADISIAREYGGTGLGLFLSRNLAEKLGGGIQVDSEKDKGTVFAISIAAGLVGDLQSLEELELNKAVYSNVDKLDAKLSGHVLLADDVLENQKLITHYVKGMGATIDVANNGKEAVQLALSHAYDLVLMDIRMPVMDGFAAVKTLRENGYQVPIISLSANNMANDIAKYKEAGFNEAAAKPIVRRSFKQLLSKYLAPASDVANELEPVYSSLVESEPEFAEIVELFLQRLPELIDKISQGFAAGDWELVRDELHRTKGVAGNYGYSELMKLIAKGEFVATSQDQDAFAALLVEIKDMEARILAAVNK